MSVLKTFLCQINFLRGIKWSVRKVCSYIFKEIWRIFKKSEEQYVVILCIKKIFSTNKKSSLKYFNTCGSRQKSLRTDCCERNRTNVWRNKKKKRKQDCLINDELIVDIQILQLIQKKLKIHLFSWNLLSNS